MQEATTAQCLLRTTCNLLLDCDSGGGRSLQFVLPLEQQVDIRSKVLSYLTWTSWKASIWTIFSWSVWPCLPEWKVLVATKTCKAWPFLQRWRCCNSFTMDVAMFFFFLSLGLNVSLLIRIFNVPDWLLARHRVEMLDSAKENLPREISWTLPSCYYANYIWQVFSSCLLC